MAMQQVVGVHNCALGYLGMTACGLCRLLVVRNLLSLPLGVLERYRHVLLDVCQNQGTSFDRTSLPSESIGVMQGLSGFHQPVPSVLDWKYCLASIESTEAMRMSFGF
jgi:hypothetical protein